MIAVGINAVMELLIYLIFIGVSFQAVKYLDISRFMKTDHIFASQVLLLLLAIGLGFVVGSFFIMLINTSRELTNFF
ncbi:MAG: DUF1146 family protein [Lactobacillus sp.]|nr:DUF1146 family protein [Lactobacillus sp.]MDN6052375.1 DUF1146 family protein [Lactobacillus sp.]